MMRSPWYVAAASVPAGNRIRRFFDSGQDSVSSLIADPPTFRWAGFDLVTESLPVLQEDCYEVRSGDRKVIRLCQDGTLLCRVPADPDFLAWGQTEQHFARSPLLNPVPVVELHASFVHLFAKVITRLSETPKRVDFTLRFHGAVVNNERLALTQYYSRGIRNIHRPTLYHIHSTDAEAVQSVETEQLQKNPDAAAYQVLVAFYHMFDMEPGLIPFVKEADGVKMIDIDAIRTL